MWRLPAPRLLALLALSIAGTPAHADDPCSAFAWDVGHERALFATEARALSAGRDVTSAPPLVPDRLYQLQLSAQPDVTFAAAPGKSTVTTGAHAGLASLTVGTAGVYRVSLDQPSWLDVAANGVLIHSRDFQRRPGCTAPHKTVEFVLPPGTPLTLQVSGAAGPILKGTVTRPVVQTR